ncbi:MAG TPA: ATP synthase F1 subunit gamma [Bryobacteraceae bacterium]|jgi:F-type H+-transporting ATPase subunit gamma|nr:ATP synthase F1 subunit gamma [Bryobacteraceae bacterium]
MPSLIDIRRRIRSVKNTQQITKAMKMVSAAKLRRAQDRVIAARPYAQQMREMLANLAEEAASDERAAESPWLVKREPRRIDLIFITSDKGLAGAFNSNLIKASQRFYADHESAEISLTLVGRKGRDFYRRRGAKVLGEYVNILGRPTYDDAAKIARQVSRRYRDVETDAVFLLNNEFKSVMAQRLSVLQLLPVEMDGASGKQERPQGEYIYEQSPLDMLERLMPRYVEVAIFRAMLETVAAEHAARMTAMDKASTNAKEVIDTLTLNMNRIRQAAITKEIIEVVSGAAAAE